MKKILQEGQENVDRTGVGTLSIFGQQFKYDLSDTFPALTPKRIFMRGIFEELMLYISGKTDNNILNDKNIHSNGLRKENFLIKEDFHIIHKVTWVKNMVLILDIWKTY